MSSCHADVLQWSVLLWWVYLEELAGQTMQGLLETSEDFHRWDMNSKLSAKTPPGAGDGNIGIGE